MQKLDLFKCDVCGNIIQTIIIGGGELVCCGQPMNRLEIKTQICTHTAHVAQSKAQSNATIILFFNIKNVYFHMLT